MTLNLDRERYQRLRKLFHGAAGLSGGELEAFLEEHCGSDQSLRSEARAWLGESHAEDPLGSDEALRDRLLRAFGAQTDEASPYPERIGPYRIVARIGAGGMGQVLEAVQDKPRRRVALKMIYPNWVSPRRTQRFDDEVEILGHLTHPNVARLYDSGTVDSPSGPIRYFVMELVEGPTLSEWVKRTTPSVEKRLAVLRGICSGVAEAHRRGIIHRDLKPQNVLIDAAGTPKILDFGIARMRSAEVSLDDTRTRPGELLGTLQYMSPEQLTGDVNRVDTRADVYALGVILFELLSGSLPHVVDSTSIHAAIGHLSEREPRSLVRVAPGIDRDLSTITAKALERHPEDRYPSVEALDADLACFLEHRPLHARPPSLVRRLKLFARRERKTFGALALLAATVIASVFFVLRYAYRAQADRALAVASEKAAERQSYRAQIAAASGALQVQDIATARRFLDETDPSLRRWEWSYLTARLDDSAEVWRGHRNQVWDIAFAPDGKSMATVGGAVYEAPFEQALCLWDWERGGLTYKRTVPEDELLRVAYHPSGEWIATGGGARGPTIRIWRAADGEALQSLQGHTDRIHGLVFDSAGERLFSGSYDGSVRVWSRDEKGTWSFERNLLEGGGRVRELLHRPPLLYVLTEDQPLRALDQESGEIRAELPFSGTAMDISSAGAIAIGRADGLIEVRGLEGDSNELARFDQGMYVAAVCFSGDGKTLYSGGTDASLRVWSMASGRLLAHWAGHDLGINRLGQHPTEPFLVSGSHDTTVRLWETSRTPSAPYTDADIPLVRWFDSATERGWTAKASLDGRIEILAERGASTVATLQARDDRAHTVALGDRGKWIAYDVGERVALQSLENDSDPVFLEGHTQRIHCLAKDPLNRRLCSGSTDGTLRIWDVERLSEILVLEGHQGWVWDAAWSPDGTRILSGGNLGQAFVWDATTGSRLLELEGHVDLVNAVGWSPDGKLVATGGGDGVARIWDAQTGALLRSLTGHRGTVLDLAFHPLQDRLVTVSNDRVAILWNSRSGEEILGLHAFNYPLMAVAWGPEGRDLYVGHTQGFEILRGL